MARQARRIFFFLFHSWRRIFSLIIIVVVLVIITKHLYSTDPAYKVKNSVSSVGNAKLGHAASTMGENSQYVLSDEAVPRADESLQIIPDKFIGLEKCPACFGLDMCDEVKNGFVRIAFPETPNYASQHGIYYGKWHEKQIVMRKIGVDENRFGQFEKFLCENVTKSKTCDISEVITKSFAAKTAAFEIESLRDAYTIAHKQPSELQFAVCVSEPFIDGVKDSVGLSDEWTLDKAAMLYTSMVINQEVLLLKTASMFTKPRPFPRLLGACGQLILLDHHGVPLDTYISANWEKRSDLALQLLNIVDLFANGDVAWYVMYTDFRFENFDVTSDEQVVIINLESLSVVDKESIAEYDDTTSDEPCNEPCFSSFLTNIVEVPGADRRKWCARAPHVVTDAMYALLCKHILSDLAEHHDVDDEEADEGATLRPRGLLHSPPDQIKQELSDLLTECVVEAVAGSRLQAIEDLSETLQQFVSQQKDQDL